MPVQLEIVASSKVSIHGRVPNTDQDGKKGDPWGWQRVERGIGVSRFRGLVLACDKARRRDRRV